MAAGHPAQAEVRRAVRRVLTDVPPGGLVLAAVSGGADSLALAHGLLDEGGAAGCRTGVAVVDHGLQHGSAEVAERAAEQCRGMRATDGRRYEVVEVVRTEVRVTGAGPEADARDARYAALVVAAAQHDAVLVLLGHTRDDQAEQVLLGLLRGSGARSLSGIPPTTTRDGTPFARPLLTVTRATTEAVCVAAGLEPWQDPMNDDPAYSRVRARGALADLATDLGPGIPEALARSAELLRADADHLDALAEAALTPFADDDAPLAADLAALPAAIRTRVLRRLLVARGARPGDLSAGHVAEVDRLVTHPRGQGPLHLPGVDVARTGNGAQARLSITPRGLV